MKLNRLADRVHTIAFKQRGLLAAVSLLLLVYCNLYLWRYIPYFTYDFNWRPDHTLRVVELFDESIAAPFLQAGDAIIAIDGRPVQRSLTFFPLTARQTQYELTIIRETQTLRVTVPYLAQPDTVAFESRLVSGLLSFITWAIGCAVLRYAWVENKQALWLGLIFLLASVVVLGLNAMVMGVPYAYLFSQPLILLLAVGWIYLGLLPSYKPFGPKTQSILFLLVLGALAYGALSLVEAWVLLPKGTSLEAYTGISLYRVGVFGLGIGGIALLGLLFVRRLRTKTVYLQQQLNLLLLFTSFSFLPAILFAFLPLSLWGQPLLPMPFALIGLLLAPLGYFYVIFRHAYLELDKTFGHYIPYAALILSFVTLYSLALYGLEQWLTPRFTTFQLAIFLILVTAILAPAIVKTAYGWMHRAFFGRTSGIHERLKELTHLLIHQPDIETLEAVVNQICTLLNIPYATLATQSNERPLQVQVGSEALWSQQFAGAHCSAELLLRSRAPDTHPLFTAFALAEIILPLQARDKLIGVWVLSKPRDGYIQQGTLTFLEHATATLSMGIELVSLLDSAEILSRQIITVQEDEQRRFATLLHDEPLQKLYAVRASIAQTVRTTTTHSLLTATLTPIADALSTLEAQLRDVYETSSPQLLEYDLPTMIYSLADAFSSETGIAVACELQLPETLQHVHVMSLTRVVYHVVRESFNNIAKHSGATAVLVSTSGEAGTLQLRIADNGLHGPVNQLTETELLRQRHFGLVGMKAWAKSVGGTLTLIPQDAGTDVLLIVPLHQIASPSTFPHS